MNGSCGLFNQYKAKLPAISLSKSLLERYGNIKSIRDSKEQISEALLFFALMRMPTEFLDRLKHGQETTPRFVRIAEM